jgi:hypothetical protein
MAIIPALQKLRQEEHSSRKTWDMYRDSVSQKKKKKERKKKKKQRKK